MVKGQTRISRSQQHRTRPCKKRKDGATHSVGHASKVIGVSDPPPLHDPPPLQRMQGRGFPQKAGEPGRWEPTRVSGGGWRMGKDGRFRAESLPYRSFAGEVNFAHGHLVEPLTGIVRDLPKTFREEWREVKIPILPRRTREGWGGCPCKSTSAAREKQAPRCARNDNELTSVRG